MVEHRIPNPVQLVRFQPEMQMFGTKTKRDKCDEIFSNWIRRRDGYRCVICHKQFDKEDTPSLQFFHNSHFWGRGNKSVRFHPDNCDGLCNKCHHRLEDDKQGDYRTFKIEQLGTRRYNALSLRKNGFLRYGKQEKEAILIILKKLWETDNPDELLAYLKENTVER